MKLKSVFTLMCILALYSCQDAPAPAVQDTSPDDAAPIEDAYSDQVSYRDINKAIAAITCSDDFGMERSRASMYSVDSLISKDGVLTALVVNFANDGGFILLSPQKTFYPVMAYSDKGHFDVNVEGKPVEEWTEDMSDIISQLDYLPSDSIEIYRRMWNDLLFESSINSISTNAVSRAEGEVSQEEYQQLIQIARAKRTEFEQKGYKTYSLEEVFKNDPEGYESIIQEATVAIFPIYDHLVLALSFAVEINNSNNYTKQNLLQTSWNQTGGFNQSFHFISDSQRAYAGCGPVAMGQIMKYYQYPPSYPWTKMHNSYGTKETSDFLYELAIRAHASFKSEGTKTSVENMQSTLESYGYICERDVYSLSRTLSDINSNKPVLMTGKEEKYHAWVSSGFNICNGTQYYDFYTMTHHYSMGSFSRSNVYSFLSTSLYMNWGWGGAYDGYYVETSNIVLPNGQYTKGRINIYINKP